LLRSFFSGFYHHPQPTAGNLFVGGTKTSFIVQRKKFISARQPYIIIIIISIFICEIDFDTPPFA
jgi:hypothetical protein